MSPKILLLLLIPSFSSAAVLVGLDLTLQPFEQDKIVPAVMTWVDQNTEDGETIQIVAITARTQTEPDVLGEVTLPARPGLKGSDRAAQLDELKIELTASLKRRRSYPRSLLQQSRIADLFLYAGSTFTSRSSKGKIRRIAVWSDMLEVDDQTNFETGNVRVEDLKIPRLSGSVEIRGVRSAKYRNSDMWAEVRTAWTKVLTDAGLKVRSYSSSY